MPLARKFLTSAIFKLVAQAGTCPPQAAAVVDEYSHSKYVDLQQRCLEFQNILTTAPQYLGERLPVDASAEVVDVDINLSFLDGFCPEALANGARPSEKPEDDDDELYGAQSATTEGGGLQLNTRGVANVWGKRPAAAVPPPEPASAAPPRIDRASQLGFFFGCKNCSGPNFDSWPRSQSSPPVLGCVPFLGGASVLRTKPRWPRGSIIQHRFKTRLFKKNRD